LTEKKRRKSRIKKANAASATSGGRIPTREQILQFITDNPDRTGKRDLAKAFGIKGDARIALKKLIRELQDEGLLIKSGKRLSKPGELPPVGLIDIITRDRDGGLLATPVQWDETTNGSPPSISVRIDRKNRGQTAGVGDRVLARLMRNPGTGIDYSAKIIKRLEKRSDTVLGVLRVAQSGQIKEIRLEAIQKRQPEVEIQHDTLGEAKDGDLVEVEISKSGRYGLKRGKIVRVIGSVSGEKAASMIAIHANEIRHIFPDEVTREAKNIQALKPGDSKSHEDWRDLPLITIDPADAKDHDDAIFAEPDENQESGGADGHIVYVAIADVSYYVRPGSEMGKEALLRGNSTYFPDQVVPMLPERISNDLCSLREDEIRPALAVRMVFAADGKKVKHGFHRILMKSHAKLAYAQAQAAIDGSPDTRGKSLLKPVLAPLWEAYACLKRCRDHRQPLELDLPERKLILNKDGTVDRVMVPDRLDAHKLVEEFMIQANVAAAETLERRKQPLIYRAHDVPSLDKLEKLREFLKSMNISLAKTGALKPMQFNAILATVRDSDKEELVNQVVLRSQSQAEYSTQNVGHFGLNLSRYAHFTSPIRRYADLTVHRALIAALGLGEGATDREEEAQLTEIAAEISLTERKSMQAERETVDRLIANHLASHLGESFHGRINGVTRAGLFVTLADTGADGFVPISMLGDEYFHFDETSYSVIGENSKLSFQMGQEVEVKLVEAAPVAGALRFEMLSEGKKSDRLPRSRNTNRNTSGGYRNRGRSGAPRGGPAGGRRKRH